MLKSLFKHSTVYFIGLIFGKFFSTAVFILLARILLPEKSGVVTFFVTLQTIFTVFGDWGLNQWYQKHIHVSKPSVLFPEIFVARSFTLFLEIFIFCLLYLLGAVVFPPMLFWSFLISLFPEALLSVSEGFYLVEKKSWYIALKTPSKMVILLVGLLLLMHSSSVNSTVFFLLIGSFFTVVWFFPWKFIGKFRNFSFSRIWKTLRASSAYALLITTSYVYARGDSVVVQYAVGSTGLGLYGAAYRYLESLSLLPSALAQNLFHLSSKKNAVSVQHALAILGMSAGVGAAVALATYFASHFLTVTLLGPAFAPAESLVRIFSVVIFFFFVNAPLSTIVQSSDIVKKFLPFGIANTLLNLCLNIFFVPRYGITAAAFVMLTTEVTGFLINVFFAQKVYAA